jgi:hypothetical protein
MMRMSGRRKSFREPAEKQVPFDGWEIQDFLSQAPLFALDSLPVSEGGSSDPRVERNVWRLIVQPDDLCAGASVTTGLELESIPAFQGLVVDR